MRVALGIGIAAVAAALLIASASAGPPAPILVRIAATHAQPRAERAFTGNHGHEPRHTDRDRPL